MSYNPFEQIDEGGDLNTLFNGPQPQFQQHQPLNNPALRAPDPELAAHVPINNPIAPAGPKMEPSKIQWKIGNDGSSFSSQPRVEDPNAPKKKLILRSTVIDKFTTKRKRVELTPSMCTKGQCQFDIAKANGYPDGYHSVPVQFREAMLEALQQHIAHFHTLADELIVEEDTAPTMWLGDPKQL